MSEDKQSLANKIREGEIELNEFTKKDFKTLHYNERLNDMAEMEEKIVDDYEELEEELKDKHPNDWKERLDINHKLIKCSYKK